MITIYYAHPRPRHSIANRVLIDAVRDLPGVEVRTLFELYPDFSIDVTAEQRALAATRLVVWQHPVYWYGVPSMLKLWFDEVLAYGWAYGEGGTALEGKDCLWVATTGAGPDSYAAGGEHGHPFDAFVPPIRQTAVFCGMNWLDPLVVHAAHRTAPESLERIAAQYRERLAAYIEAASKKGG